MSLAFYAPMKSPLHKIPSGDREIARAFFSLFEKMNLKPFLASEFRSWSGRGGAYQEILKIKAEKEVLRISNQIDKSGDVPDLWFTYHLYHKAPDWIGPPICQKYEIPYYVAEASIAEKQKKGVFALGYKDSIAALSLASGVLNLAGHDRGGLMPYVNSKKMIRFNPFTAIHPQTFDRGQIAEDYKLDPFKKWVLVVAMMRAGDKLASYQKLAEMMKVQSRDDWQLVVIGDGDKRAEIEACFKPIAAKVRFMGALGPEALSGFYNCSDLMIWPAINEAFGMALLEAQASGLPVIAGDYGSVGQIIEHQRTGFVVPKGQDHLFGEYLARLLEDKSVRLDMKQNALKRAKLHHSVEAAERNMSAILKGVSYA